MNADTLQFIRHPSNGAEEGCLMSILVHKNARIQNAIITEDDKIAILFNFRVINLNDPNADYDSPTGADISMSIEEAKRLRDALTDLLRKV